MAGVELPVTPVLRPVWYTEPVPDLPPGLPMTVDFSTGFYFHPEGPGLLFGMADPDQPPGFDQRMRDDWLERVGEVMERRAPAMLEMGVAGGWTGFYEVSPDHNALIGRAEEVEGFVYGTGFSGHGFLQSPAVGEILRDLVLGPRAVRRRGAAVGLAVRPRRDAARARDRLVGYACAPGSCRCAAAARAGRPAATRRRRCRPSGRAAPPRARCRAPRTASAPCRRPSAR